MNIITWIIKTIPLILLIFTNMSVSETYNFDNISLLRNGERWFPVMGEIHFSRYPKQFWHESLLKMKAGGVDIVSTYVFWIHHEEIEGEYDFTGSRDLRTFVKTCKEVGIKLWLRIGPWAHGEARNGGFPDWLLKKDFEPRTNDKKYFSLVEKWYRKIYEKVEGYFYSEENKENPIIGIQIENEYGHVGGLTNELGEIHMEKLTQMAKDIGFIVPFYTATGWGGAWTGGLIPVMGGYCDAPWDSRTTEIEPSGNYIFTYERNDHNIGSDHGIGEGTTFDYSKFPYLTAELGGGLQMTKHRRTIPSPKDIGAMSLVKLGSGVNLLGYYMYHGGTNPDGKLTSLQESTETGYPNDVPEKSYDFHAPVREYGQIAPVFREIKLLTLFVNEFGTELCYLPAVIPDDNPLKPDNTIGLRYSYRTDGKKGYVFINNYVRHQNMSEHKEVEIPLPDKSGNLPPITIHSGEYLFLPFNMEFGNVTINSAYCSPLCILKDGTVVFYASEFSKRKKEFFQFTSNNINPKYLVISREDALNAWKLYEGRLIISKNDIIQDKNGWITINGRGKECSLLVYPDFEEIPKGFKKNKKINMNIAEDLSDVNFTSYSKDFNYFIDNNTIIFNEISSTEGKKVYKVDISALVKEFIEIKENTPLNDCFVKILYQGESAKLYSKNKKEKILIADNFFSGIEYSWEIGLKRFIDSDIDFSNLELEIFPLTSKDKIYFEKQIHFTGCLLKSINLELEWSYELNMN